MSDTPPGTTKVVNELSSSQASHALTNVGDPIIEILNNYASSHDPMLALYGGLYAMGCALANIGAVLDERADLQQQLSPLLEGYAATMTSMVH